MFHIIRQSIYDFYKSYKKYVFFALLYTLFTSVFFVPFISFIFNRMLLMLGSGSLLNGDVYKIALSPTGLIGMLFISLLAVVVLFIEFGVIIIISQKTFFSKNVLVTSAFVTALRKLPKLLRFGTIQLVLLLGMLMPFIELSPIPALLDFNLPIYLTDLYYRLSDWAIIFYILGGVVVLFLFFRFIFTLHFIFIEDQSIWPAMKHSWKLARGNKLKIIVNVFILNVLFFVIVFSIINLLSAIPSITGMSVLGELINNYLVTFSSFITLIFSLLFIPVNIVIITRLFFVFKENEKETVVDELKIHRPFRLSLFERLSIRYFKKRRNVLFVVILVYMAAIFFINYSVNEQSAYLKWSVQVAAHRGDIHTAPENTISSIRNAIDMGVDAVEIDVMLTKDDVLVLHHDYTLNRTAGISKKVEELTYRELSEIPVEQMIAGEVMNERIPTLEEALIEMEDENVNTIIDIKLPNSRKNEELAEGIVHFINKYEIKDRMYVQSFDYNILQEIRERDEEIRIGQILFLSAGNLRNLDVDFYTVRQTMLSERFIRNAQRLDREVWVWTVNIERNINEVLKYDINGIITDYPERLLQ